MNLKKGVHVLRPVDYMINLLIFLSVGLFLFTMNWRVLGIGVVIYLTRKVFRMLTSAESEEK